MTSEIMNSLVVPMAIVVAAFLHLAATHEAAPLDVSATAALLAADDECSSSAFSLGAARSQAPDCATNALQRSSGSRHVRNDIAGDTIDSSSAIELEPYVGCVNNCMQGGSADLGSARGTGYIQNYKSNCAGSCGDGGFCPQYCGEGNACCKFGSSGDPPECKTTIWWPVEDIPTCVQVGAKRLTPPNKSHSTYNPPVHVLASPSDAVVHTFYIYRAVDGKSYAPENVNAANLPGVLWYLHNEVVSVQPWKFGITRILRMRVQTRAPKPLSDAGMNFGVRYAFDGGKCTGPWSCEEQFKKYGYFVGCNYVNDFPTQEWKRKNHYKDAIWYSLPGSCSSRPYFQQDYKCRSQQPGGACAGTPTGKGDCTYSYAMAGSITIAELEGELRWRFWKNKWSEAACQRRVEVAEKLFMQKYGLEELPSPKCDFDAVKFYGHRVY